MYRTPLYDAQRDSNARYETSGEWLLPLDFGDTIGEVRAVRSRIGLLDRSARGKLVLTGSDRFSWLQGMVSNDVRQLEEGTSSIQACILNATGHLLADVRIVNWPG